MSRPDLQRENTAISFEAIIDKIRSRRNERIKALLNDQNLIPRYKELVGVTLSDIKREFIKRDLRALLITPVDLVHYASIINHIREANYLNFREEDNLIFDKELDSILGKYQY